MSNLGPFGPACAYLGTLFGPVWLFWVTSGHLGLSWGRLALSWGRLEAILGQFGAFLGHLEAILGHFGDFLGHLEGISWGQELFRTPGPEITAACLRRFQEFCGPAWGPKLVHFFLFLGSCFGQVFGHFLEHFWTNFGTLFGTRWA